ncbi:FMN-binding negative transcriptional regulator [Pseudodonghicola flavimaris]|uniref:FMN-binding negative transcriptional regulator n=1 Tax=Pseudodonghicola flavimaris TaxID=3050036 RepID=A0ABT7EX24_9RHOB|nr:FMN-binding negative transcriptional regulator [Pseudodonghicola flavimaris]MDK3016894.1 FMN-binding negative transcriptional regulator [Pseudodonghicola flavimaris]
MHPNPVFHTASVAENLAFARARSFGVLAVSVAGAAPMLSHVPFLLSEDGETVELHLVRSNPIARALSAPLPARLAVNGPDSYVSPDWYGIDDQVPTWNYVAVHLTGVLELRPQEELAGVLDRLSDLFEDRLLPKIPWRRAKMDPEVLARLMRMIVPVRLRIETVEGTWKLGQNKPEAVRLAAAAGIEEAGIGAELAALAGLMRQQ